MARSTSYRTRLSPRQPREGGRAHHLEARDEGHSSELDEVADLSSRGAFHLGLPFLLHGRFPVANKGRKIQHRSQYTTRRMYYVPVARYTPCYSDRTGGRTDWRQTWMMGPCTNEMGIYSQSIRINSLYLDPVSRNEFLQRGVSIYFLSMVA
jgi:hypothetical protein